MNVPAMRHRAVTLDHDPRRALDPCPQFCILHFSFCLPLPLLFLVFEPCRRELGLPRKNGHRNCVNH
jgi:hypothetical protein